MAASKDAQGQTQTMAGGQRKPTARGKRTAQKVAEDDAELQQTQVAPSADDGLPLSKEEGGDDELYPLPESASGFRCDRPSDRRTPDDYPRPLSATFSYPCRDILELLMSPVFAPPILS